MFSWFGKISFTPCTKVAQFAEHLKEGRLMGSRCGKCGTESFPPRADCPECMSGEFEFVPWEGKGRLLTFTRIDAAPTGFQDLAPYVVCLVELDRGGRAVGWKGESLKEDELRPDMPVELKARFFEEIEPIKLYFSVERR